MSFQLELARKLEQCELQISNPVIKYVFSVYPSYKKTVFGEGMPKRDSKEKGNLYIEFDVVFPERLSPERKLLIKEALL